MSTKFLSPSWRMPRNANQSKFSNYSMDFYGGGETIALNTSTISFADSFSISMWINPSSLSGFQMLFGGSGYSGGSAIGHYIYDDTVRTYVSVSGSTTQIFQSSALLNIGSWTHIIIQREKGTKWEMWIDGVLEETNTSASLTDDLTSANSAIAKHYNSGNYNFNGKINEVSIFDYALSLSQVTTLWGGGTSVSNPMVLPSPPVAYYPLGTSAWNGQYLAENNAIEDYVFDFGTYTSNDRIVINNTFDTIITGANFTISSWINLDSVTSNELKFIFTNETLQFAITDKITTYLRGASGYFLSPFDGNTTLTTGKWYNVVLVKSGSDYTYYLNGSPDGTVNNSTSAVNSSETTSRIGMYFQDSNYGFDGQLSNIQIFNSALSGPEVETLYNYGSPIRTLANIPQSSNLQGWWKLDASDTYDSSTGNWTIEDHAGSNDGTSSGMSQANLVQSDLQTVAPYSKYALDFDASSSDYIDTNYNANLIGNAPQSFSIWFKSKSTGVQYKTLMGQYQENILHGWGIEIGQPSNLDKITWYSRNSSQDRTSYGSALTQNQWYHLVVVINSTSLNNVNYSIYLDGTPLVENATSSYYDNTSVLNSFQINNRYANNAYYGGGNFVISNVSIWNTALTSAQVTEIYNQGLPGNLNSHSAYSNLVSWWQLGENSFFDGNDWIVADEKGSNNGTSTGMPVGALTNGVGTTANGVSSGMSEGNLVGDAPYSTANALSSGMSVVSRVTDVAPSPPPLLLDTYTGSQAAYSLRRLSNSYTGNLIRVTKKVSNVISTTDIGYNSSNELDTTALATFASGADNGEVKVDIWYDQSGNGNNVTHSTYSQLPKIYESGSLITENSKPALKVARGRLMTTGTPISSQQSSIFYVTKVLPGNNSYDRIFSIGTSTSGYFSQLNTIASQNFICWYNNKVSLGGDFYSQRLITFYNDSTTQYLRQDGVQIDSDSKTASSYGSKDISLFTDANIGKGFVGVFQEFIFYPSEQSSNLTGIETNIKNYHGI